MQLPHAQQAHAPVALGYYRKLLGASGLGALPVLHVDPPWASHGSSPLEWQSRRRAGVLVSIAVTAL